MLNLQEETVMNALYSCAAITKNTIRKLGGDEDTILNLINKKYIKKEKIDIDNKSIAIYKLTKQGEKAYIDKFGKKHFVPNTIYLFCGRKTDRIKGVVEVVNISVSSNE